MADDVELFIFGPAQLASQKSEFFEEVYFRHRTCNGGLQFGFKHGGRVIDPVFFEFTGIDLCYRVAFSCGYCILIIGRSNKQILTSLCNLLLFVADSCILQTVGHFLWMAKYSTK